MKAGKNTTYRIAHFSDFHIGNEDELQSAMRLVQDAISQGADHLIITGDLLERADMPIAAVFWDFLKEHGWATAERCTFAPGNHDVFAISDIFPTSPAELVELFKRSAGVFTQSPSRARARLAKITASSRHGSGAEQLCPDSAFAVGKVLSGGSVVVAAVDTTRKGRIEPWLWQEGELSTQERNAVTRFFAQHKAAKHRILAMHHSPLTEDIAGPFNQLFAEPKPEVIQEWLKSCGATHVLCGHIHQVHSIENSRLSSTCRILRAGTAGGWGDDQCVYHLLDLQADGKTKTTRIRV